ncbi:hypothetical protein P6B95_19970 [Streptomyces atratus]|uniref:hypothetical protein n=1 Tax=Streptomyces atratus TaxID=1893 RepID=UPI002AC33FFE|nr:hypothetical protein [Streptomyces atratus]WPW29431.1 hypothetical protein P6B95_19970 [Streptomyces atratus]
MGIADQFKDKAQELADQAKRKQNEGEDAGRAPTQGASGRAPKTSQQGRNKAQQGRDRVRDAADDTRERFDR